MRRDTGSLALEAVELARLAKPEFLRRVKARLRALSAVLRAGRAAGRAFDDFAAEVEEIAFLRAQLVQRGVEVGE